MERIWLDVPFSEKDEAKAAGARWDPQARRWFSPRSGKPGLDRWVPVEPVPELLPGEDRSLGSGLFVDLVPSTCWFTNARSCIEASDWDRVRRMVLTRAGGRCEVCDRPMDRTVGRWLEVHERWAFDDAQRVQSLRRLICLCTDCHTVTHFGLAQIRGLDKAALAHLEFVTGLTHDEARRHVRAAFQLWQARSTLTWTLDLSMLANAGISLVQPPTAASRAVQAFDRL